MRPTDENQYGSTRPNLMSSSRRGSEESILSMLERDSGRSRRWSSGRMTLYGAAVLVVAGLVGTLAWLARDNPGSQQVEPTLVLKPTPMVAMADVTAVPADTHGHAEGAAIIDSPEPPPLGTKSATVSDPPPLMLVTPPDARPAPKASETVPEPAPERPAAAPAKPAKPVAARAAPPRARAAEKAAPVARSAARRAPAVKKGKTAERGRVDTDVALISAIISHSGKRTPEEGEAEKPDSGQ